MKTKLSSLIAIVLLMSVLIASCAPAPTAAPVATEPPAVEAPVATEAPATEAPKPPAPEFIELGSSISLTGKYGSLGGMILPGYEYAVA